MAVVELSYGDIIDAKSMAKKVAKECENYREEIEKKVVRKLGKLTLGATGYTSSADAYAKRKMNELSSKKDAFERYADKLDAVVNDTPYGAKAVDRRVRDIIERKYQIYKKLNGIKVNPIYEGLCNLFTGLSNADGFLKILKEAMKFDKMVLDRIWDDLKYWYRCGGGKEVLKVVAGIVVAVAAIAAVIAAWPVMVAAFTTLLAGFTMGALWTLIVATAGFVGACIGFADAVVNVIHEGSAAWNIWNNRPADARWDSNTNKLTDWLNRTVSNSRFLNRFTTGMSDFVAKTEIACALINLADLAVNGTKFIGGLKKAYDHGGWKTVYKNIDKKTFAKFKNKKGEITFKSVKTGLKATQKYANRVTQNRNIEGIKKAFKLSNSSIGNLDTKIKPYKNVSKYITKVVDKGVWKGSVKYATERVIDWTHAGKTLRSAKGTFKDYGENRDAINRIVRNIV